MTVTRNVSSATGAFSVIKSKTGGTVLQTMTSPSLATVRAVHRPPASPSASSTRRCPWCTDGRAAAQPLGRTGLSFGRVALGISVGASWQVWLWLLRFPPRPPTVRLCHADRTTAALARSGRRVLGTLTAACPAAGQGPYLLGERPTGTAVGRPLVSAAKGRGPGRWTSRCGHQQDVRHPVRCHGPQEAVPDPRRPVEESGCPRGPWHAGHHPVGENPAGDACRRGACDP